MNRELYYMRMNYRFEKIIVFYFINFRQYLTCNSRGTQHTLYIRFFSNSLPKIVVKYFLKMHINLVKLSGAGGGGGREGGGWMVRETIFQKQTYPDDRNKQIFRYIIYIASFECQTSVMMWKS